MSKRGYKRRYNKKKKLDCAWTLEMHLALFDLQTECVLCASNSDLGVDHVRPLARGFGLTPGNAVILCNKCNGGKSGKDLHKLPIRYRHKLTKAAKEFERYWNDLHPSILKLW